MSNPRDIIDLTQSFSLAKVHLTSEVIDLLDTDESFNTSFETIVERRKSVSCAASRRKKINCQQPRHNSHGDGHSEKESGNGRKSKSNNRLGDCPICWDGLGKNPLASTKCGHVYCLKCLEQSLKIEKRCPTCRRVLKGNSAYHPLYINLL